MGLKVDLTFPMRISISYALFQFLPIRVPIYIRIHVASLAIKQIE